MQNKLKPKEMEQLKAMQTQGIFYAHIQIRLFFLQPLIFLSPPQPQSSSLHFPLKLTISKRNDVSQKALDLRKLHFDPGKADSSNSRAGKSKRFHLGGYLEVIMKEGLVLALDSSQLSDSFLVVS